MIYLFRFEWHDWCRTLSLAQYLPATCSIPLPERLCNQANEKPPERVGDQDSDNGEWICDRAGKSACQEGRKDRTDQDDEEPVGQSGTDEREDRFAYIAKDHNRQPNHRDKDHDEERSGWSAKALHHASDVHKWLEEGKRAHANDEGPMKAVEMDHVERTPFLR
jgi:hypothetical protein